jgi:hypothetical protein
MVQGICRVGPVGTDEGRRGGVFHAQPWTSRENQEIKGDIRQGGGAGVVVVVEGWSDEVVVVDWAGRRV